MDLGSLGGLAGQARILTQLPGMWDDIKDKDWHGFYERISQARDNGEADHEQLSKVEEAGHNAQAQGEGFPHSAGDLVSLLTKHMPK